MDHGKPDSCPPPRTTASGLPSDFPASSPKNPAARASEESPSDRRISVRRVSEKTPSPTRTSEGSGTISTDPTLSRCRPQPTSAAAAHIQIHFFIIEQRSADRRPARRRTGHFPTPFRYCLRSSARIGPTPAQILKTCASLNPRTSRPRAERTGKPCGRSARLSGTQRPASRVRYRPAGAVAALSAANMCLP